MTMDTFERTIKDIIDFGYQTINVSDDLGLPFSYTVGLFRTFNHPEIIISGLRSEIANQLLSDIALKLKKGVHRQEDKTYDDLIDGFPCVFKKVQRYNYDEYLGRAIWLYQGYEFPVLQCIWPSKDNKFPWENGYNVTIQEELYK